MGIVYDAELSFVFLSNSIIEFPNLRKDFEECYEKDKYRFYERARQSKHYNHYNFGDNILESEVAMRRIFGILLCSEEDENIREYVYKKLLSTNIRFKELVKRPKKAALEAFIEDMIGYTAKSYNAMNAPARFLAYLFYSTYGTDSEDEIVNKYLSDCHNIDLQMSQYNEESYRKAFQRPKPDHILITRRVQNLIDKLRTGINASSFADFKDSHILKNQDISVDPELYSAIEAYYHSGDKGMEDTLKAIMIESAASLIMNVNGSGMCGLLGQTSITKDEEDMLILILAHSTLLKNNRNGKSEWRVNVSDYLLGLIIMLMAKEIRNMKEFYFRNNSETQYLELQRLENLAEEKDLEIERLRAELARANEQGERQKEEIQRLTDAAFKENKDAIRPYASEISELNGRIRELEENLEVEQQKTAELNTLREFAFTARSEYIPTETTATLAELIQGKKIIIVGGHVNWRNKMKEQYPAITFLDGHNVSFDNSILDKTDFILLNTSNMSHKVYYKVIDYLRDRKLRFDYLGRSVNQELLEAEIASVLQEKM